MKTITINATWVWEMIPTAYISTFFTLSFDQPIDISDKDSPSANEILEFNAWGSLSFQFFEESRIHDIWVRWLAGTIIKIIYDVHDMSGWLPWWVWFGIPQYDEINLSYTGSDMTSVIYKYQWNTVSTLTLSYVSGDLVNVTRT